MLRCCALLQRRSKKRNGVAYVYQVTGKHYKKDKKYTVENRKLIGEMVDEQWMIPN